MTDSKKPEYNYDDVYESLIRLAKREKIEELPASMFVLQIDAHRRLREHDNIAFSIFASALYNRRTHDDSHIWGAYFMREYAVFTAADIDLFVFYLDYKTAREAANAIYDLCKLLANGQIRVLQTHGPRGTLLVSELFYVHGRTTRPLGYSASVLPFMMHSRLLKLHTHVQQNRADIDQVALPDDAKLFKPELTKAYDKADRTIDWGDPQPLTYQQWIEIDGDPGIGVRRITNRIKLTLAQMVLGLAYWQSWVFILVSGIVWGVVPYLPVVGGWLNLVAWIASYGWFVAWALPRVVEMKDEDAETTE